MNGSKPKFICTSKYLANHSKNLPLVNAEDKPKMPPNQINVFHAALVWSKSSHLMIPNTNVASIATIATAVASILKPNVGKTQPRIARIAITIRPFSDAFIGPNSAKPSAAIFLLSISFTEGRSYM